MDISIDISFLFTFLNLGSERKRVRQKKNTSYERSLSHEPEEHDWLSL